MSTDGKQQRLDVIRQHIASALQSRVSPAGAQQHLRAARTDTEQHLGMIAGRLCQRDDISQQIITDRDILTQPLRCQHIRRARSPADIQCSAGSGRALQNLYPFPAGGIPQLHPDHEPVHLRVRKRESALIIDRILGRHHHERPLQLKRLPIHADLALLHALQQARLGTRRRPVDFVRENNLSEQGTGAKVKLPILLIIEVNAGQIRWKQIRRELNPLKAEVEGSGEALGQKRLSCSRHILQQHMPPGEERREQQIYLLSFANNDPPNIVP
ncbi:hypothetical protein D3C71_1417930 [compost metagenome]